MTVLIGLLFSACAQSQDKVDEARNTVPDASAYWVTPDQDTLYPVIKSDAEWKEVLSEEAYEVLRKEGTERAFSGKYWDNKAEGVYTCAACGMELFSSDTKFKSGTGWPSFYAPIAPENVVEIEDRSHGMVRTEVVCARCGGHLGHVFPDGPPPTGERFCLNSVALGFEKRQ